MAEVKKEINPVWKAMKPFVTGSMSGSVATVCIQPIDMVKVRIQLNAGSGGSVNPAEVFKTVVAEDGFMSLYKGLSAGLTRQVVYTGARLGLYDMFIENAKGEDGKVSFLATSGCALAAGGIGAVIGNPADLSLVRMQADNMLPAEQRRNYKHVFDALARIRSEEGFGGLFKGAGPTAARAMALNLGMLSGNTNAKELLGNMGVTGAVQTFGASAIAGFFAAFFSLPCDFIKTQVQNAKPRADGSKLGAIECIGETFKTGGITRFWAGFPTYYFRIAPHAMITLIMQNEIKKVWAANGL